MNIKDYLKHKSRKEFADQIGTTINYINNLCQHAAIPGRLLALRIEQASGGVVTRMELLYPESEKRGPPTD